MGGSQWLPRAAAGPAWGQAGKRNQISAGQRGGPPQRLLQVAGMEFRHVQRGTVGLLGDWDPRGTHLGCPP